MIGMLLICCNVQVVGQQSRCSCSSMPAKHLSFKGLMCARSSGLGLSTCTISRQNSANRTCMPGMAGIAAQ